MILVYKVQLKKAKQAFDIFTAE